jgi:hypothetical protein
MVCGLLDARMQTLMAAVPATQGSRYLAVRQASPAVPSLRVLLLLPVSFA